MINIFNWYLWIQIIKSGYKVHCRICANCRSSEYLALYVLANIAMFNLTPIAIDFIDEKLSECSVVLLSLCSDCKAARRYGVGLQGLLSCVSHIYRIEYIEHEPPDEFSIAVRA